MKLNKKVILTGATGGIGKEITKLLYRRGATVLISGKDENSLQLLAKKVNKLKNGGRVFSLPYDLTDLMNIDSFIKKALNLLSGKVDVLINNAGLGYHCEIKNIVLTELEETFKVNVLAPIVLTSKLLPYVYKSKSGHIINISSFLGVKVMKNTAAYTASKHALTGFSNTLRLEARPKNVRVTLIEPGAVDTNFITRTYDKKVKEIFSKRRIKKIPPKVIAEWVIRVIESDRFVCPEVIRITPIEQAI